jgi:hypothetical protein
MVVQVTKLVLTTLEVAVAVAPLGQTVMAALEVETPVTIKMEAMVVEVVTAVRPAQKLQLTMAVQAATTGSTLEEVPAASTAQVLRQALVTRVAAEVVAPAELAMAQ